MEKIKTFFKNLGNTEHLILLGSVLILASLFGFTQYRYKMSQKNDTALEKRITSLEESLAASEEDISNLKSGQAGIVSVLTTEQTKNLDLQSQFSQVAGTVGTLDKLSKLDPRLLQKYSKVYFLNENYVPESLSTIDQKYVYSKKQIQFLTPAYLFLQQMLNDASSANAPLLVISGYRSFGTQSSLKASYKFTYGAGTANQFSADQGYSEHQLGTTIDFTTASIGESFGGFDKTTQYTWLLDNAYRYGFVLSYPEHNSYYQFEPWHWRFVGITLATKLHAANLHFYDMDQRDIDKYLISIFD